MPQGYPRPSDTFIPEGGSTPLPKGKRAVSRLDVSKPGTSSGTKSVPMGRSPDSTMPKWSSGIKKKR